MSAENELLDAAEAEIFDLLRGGGDDDRWNDWCHDTAQEAVRRVLRVAADDVKDTMRRWQSLRSEHEDLGPVYTEHWDARIEAALYFLGRFGAAECDPSTGPGVSK